MNSEGDPRLYEDYYRVLTSFVEASLDVHKVGLTNELTQNIKFFADNKKLHVNSRQCCSAIKECNNKSFHLLQCELAMVLYPVFVHMYLELVFNNHEDAGRFILY